MTVSPAQVAEEAVGSVIDPIEGQGAHVERRLGERHIGGYGPPGLRRSEAAKRMGNRRIALILAILVRQQKITGQAMIELKDVFLRFNLSHPGLDPVNQEITKPLRNEVADSHAPRLEERSWGRPCRCPAIGH